MDRFNTSVDNSAIGNAPDFPFCDIGKNVDGQNRGQLGGRSLTTTSCTAQCITEKLDDDKSRSLAQRECVHQGDFPLLIGDHQRRTEYLQMLNEAGEDISNVVTTAFQGGETELLILLECLKSTRLSQTTLDNALCEAAKQGQIECLDILRTAGAKDLDGALYCAVEADKVAVQFALLSKGAHSSSLLHTATSKGSLEYLSDKIISQNINVTDENGQTPLHIAAAKGHIKSMEKLIETRGVDINIADKSGCTPLHLAVEYGSIEAVKLLLGVEGIMVNKKNNDHSTPLHLAVRYAEEKIVPELLNADGIDVNAQNSLDQTPLHLAVRYPDKKVNEKFVRVLLNADGIDVNAEDCDGCTALHEAVEHADANIVQALLDAGIDVNQRTFRPGYYRRKRYTALHLAVTAWRPDIDIVSVLLKHKDINVKLKDHTGFTAYDRAKGECKQLVKAVLKRK